MALKEDEEEKVYQKANRLVNEENNVSKKEQYAEFGLCKSCSHFFARTHARGAYEEKVGLCRAIYYHPFRLNPEYPVKDCSSYSHVGDLGLAAMVGMATIIDTRDLLKDGYR